MSRRSTNREFSQMINRAPLFCVVAGSFALSLATMGCLQQLDTHASEGVTNVTVDPALGIGGPFPVKEETPIIAVTSDPNSGDPIDTTTDPCVKTKQDAADIRKRACQGCHEAPTAEGKALGDPLDHVLNDDSIINVASTTPSFSGWKYVIPGDPENSLIYHRVAVVQDMPKQATDATSTTLTVSISEMSVLRAWIMCLGPAPAHAADGGTH